MLTIGDAIQKIPTQIQFDQIFHQRRPTVVQNVFGAAAQKLNVIVRGKDVGQVFKQGLLGQRLDQFHQRGQLIVLDRQRVNVLAKRDVGDPNEFNAVQGHEVELVAGKFQCFQSLLGHVAPPQQIVQGFDREGKNHVTGVGSDDAVGEAAAAGGGGGGHWVRLRGCLGVGFIWDRVHDGVVGGDKNG